jgi:hypothetical protein
MRKPSLYPTDRCFICGDTRVLVTHHVFPGHGRRPISDAEGCTVRLCPIHHNMSNHSVHMDRELDSQLRMDCQARWEEREGLSGEAAHDAFRKVFGVSYL